jgi:hypothetical protein
MAEQMPTTQQNSTSTPTAPTPPNAEAARAAAEPAHQARNKPDEAGKPPSQTDNDPMRELLQQLQRARAFIANADPDLAARIQSLAQLGSDLQQRAQPGFHHQVAYAVQDLEKSLWPLPMSAELRADITRLAAMAPGLENERMQALMRTTASLDDKPLIRDIRRTAAEVGDQATQNTPAIQSSIDALENRVRLSLRPAEPPPDPRHAASGRPQGANTARGADPPTHDGPASQPTPTSGPTYPRGALDTIFRGMRPNNPGPGAPWDPPPTPMAGRLAAFESRMQESRDERALGRAEKSGRAALDALDAFRTGEGAIVMNRIREAARSEPGGIAAVLSEMREGGRFAGLRQQFNSALATERGVTAAYDKAAAALARYGQDRVGIEQVISRRPDAANISAKFEQMDAQIGEAAAGTPSRRDGKSMVDDLAQKAAELLHLAVDAVKSVFNRSPSADATTRAAPAPSMSV